MLVDCFTKSDDVNPSPQLVSVLEHYVDAFLQDDIVNVGVSPRSEAIAVQFLQTVELLHLNRWPGTK